MNLAPELVAWIEASAGGRLVNAKRQPGGARKEAWFVDVEEGDGAVAPLFLRYDRSDPSKTSDPWTLHREASVYVALQGSGVLVPRVIAVHPTLQAMLSERLNGQNWFSRIVDPDEQVATAKHFMTQLAALHRLDPRHLDLPYFPEPTSIPDMVRWELDEWDRIIAGRGRDPDPQLGFALGWLRRNIPHVDQPVVLVQGDTGPGNFMYAAGRVVAVVDWELAHLGDPMDDIAWLCLRATQEPFTDFPARLREYEELSGNAIDEPRVHYYQVMAETKLLVMRHGARAGAGGGDVGNGLVYGMLHRRLWFEAIAAFIGMELDPVEVADGGGGGDYSWLYDVVLQQLRDVVVPAVSDPLALQRTKGLARIVKLLQAADRNGRAYEAQELADIRALVEEGLDGIEDARVAVADAARAGRLEDAGYLRYLWRRTARDNELMRRSSGALADRHWPSLR